MGRIGNDIQYSSHVVNIVLPGFGDGFLSDEFGFEFQQVTRRFYQDFEDSYDSIAVVPQNVFMPSMWTAFHRNVRNNVGGIGLQMFDDSESFGSRTHRLPSVELYTRESFASNHVSSHEIAHQWGAYIDWTTLTGISRAGFQPEGHDPLWTPGETFIGGVLRPTRRVGATAGGWQIEQTPAPAKFHPFTLYATGLLAKEQLPEVTLFDDQAQFNPTMISTPPIGQPVTGTTHSATIYNVIGMLGERTGPTPSEWHRATVVVSRDGLLSSREMDYWTFFAQRLEDPNRSGVLGYDGIGSFERAVDGRVDLKTDIRPLTAPRMLEPLDVDFPPFAARDFRDVQFDALVPSRYHPGDRVRWSSNGSLPVLARSRNAVQPNRPLADCD